MTEAPFNVDALRNELVLESVTLKESYEQAIQQATAATTELVERINKLESSDRNQNEAYNALFRKIEQLEQRMARQESV